MALRHLALKTRDLKTTERFYIDVLGLRIAFPHRGMLFLESPDGDDLLNFVQTKAAFDATAGGFDHFGLHYDRDEWKAVCARVKDAGAPIVDRRGRSAIYIRDPNGYTVELYAD